MVNPQTLFTTQVPTDPNVSDGGAAYELGMKFQSTKPGQIIAIRFWKGASEIASHVGKIWSSTGDLLTQVSFTNETPSGWQEQQLSSPLIIEANTTYIVSYNTNEYFGFTGSGLATSVVNGDLKSVADGANGVFALTPNGFPTRSFSNSNYFVDVVFLAVVPSTISKVSGDNQRGPVGMALPDPLVVQVIDATNNPQSGVTVNFARTSGSGSVSPTSAVTDGDGKAETRLTLGIIPGQTTTVSATAADIGSVVFSASTNPILTNLIYIENQNPGSEDWRIICDKFGNNYVNRRARNEIAGYAAATSVNKGEHLPIYVSLAQPGQFTVDVYRLGYYDGKGGRLLLSQTLSGITQAPLSATELDDGINDPNQAPLLESKWQESWRIPVSSDWTTGMYIAKLTDARTGKESDIWFVVRDPSRKSDILMQVSFSTYLAYNNFSGHSLYPFNSIGGRKAEQVSLDVPFSQTTAADTPFNMFTRWERLLMRWLESQGYDVSYVTNVDVHANPQLLQGHKVFLSTVHDEYWSMEARNNVEAARDAQTPVNLLFLSANTCYWRVCFEDSTTGVSNRVMTCYKEDWAAYDPTRPTNRFRSPQNNKPENALLGIMYTGDNSGALYDTWTEPCKPVISGYDFVVKKNDPNVDPNNSDPYYANTGLRINDKLSQLVGFEWDGIVNNGATPPGIVLLADSPVIHRAPGTDIDSDTPLATVDNPDASQAVRYTAASGAKVCSLGSIHWAWGLGTDDGEIEPALDEENTRRAQQIIVNALADMGARPLIPNSNIIVP
jgi:hypothetical protein